MKVREKSGDFSLDFSLGKEKLKFLKEVREK